MGYSIAFLFFSRPFSLVIVIVIVIVRVLTVFSKLGDGKVLSVEWSSRERDTEDKALLSWLERLFVGGLAHLFQERDKVLGIVGVSTTQVV